jgi:hypothetical protein
MANQSGTITSTEGWRSIHSTPNDSITFTVVSGTFSVEYPVGTLAISGATSTQTLTLTNGGQMRVAVTAGSLTYALTDGADSYSLTQAEVAATQASYNAGAGRLATAHSRYFTHLYAGDQLPDDDKVYDISGAQGHAVRETDLSVAALWTTASGYFSTLNPTTTPGEELRRLKLPPLNWDWRGGESLFIWWLGKATQEAASCSILSNNIGGTTEAGFRIRVVTSTGKLVFYAQETNADGGEFINPTATTLAPFLGALSSFGVWLDAGQRKAYTYVNETLQLGGAAMSATMNTLPSAAQIADGYEFRLGGDPLTTGAASSGLATSTRALVMLKFAPTDTLPTLAKVLAAQNALRAAPQFPLAQGAL